MRSSIILLSVMVALITALARVIDKPLFIADYAFLSTHAHTITEHFLYTTLTLIVFYVLFALMIEKYSFPNESLLILLATPALITSFVIADNALVTGILLLLITLFWSWHYLTGILALAIIVLSPQAIVFLPVLLTVYFLQKKYVPFTLLLLASIAILIVTQPTFMLTAGFAELGLLGGLSIFIFLLAITGVVLVWTKETYPYALGASILLGAGMLFFELRILVAITAAILGGYALKKLIDQEWNLESIRNVSVLLVVCGLLFAATVTVSDAMKEPPTQQTQELLRFLHHIDQAVFVLEEHHSLLTWNDIVIAQVDYELILESRNIDDTRELLPQIIVLNNEDRAPNLRFLIEFTDDFPLIYANEEWKVWEFINS